jgi:hypothetical protein
MPTQSESVRDGHEELIQEQEQEQELVVGTPISLHQITRSQYPSVSGIMLSRVSVQMHDGEEDGGDEEEPRDAEEEVAPTHSEGLPATKREHSVEEDNFAEEA